MPELNELMTRESVIDRLEHQKHSLESHIRDLENQLRDTGRHLVAVQEHIRRLRCE
jgi:chaperonin cofactor prefoldin